MHSIPWWQRDRPYILALAFGASDIDVAAVLQRGSSVPDGRLHDGEPEASRLCQWMECVVVAAKTNTEIKATALIGWCEVGVTAAQ